MSECSVTRALDAILASMALIVLAPLFFIVIPILRLTGEGEVFYRQIRVGQGGRPFSLLKFATMLKNSPSMMTGTVTVKNDPRVLPFGRFLRKTKINELPQLINIVLGDMSIVGPRPQAQRCFDVFPENVKSAILSARPGLSGIGSIVFRSEEEILGGRADPLRFYDDVIAPYKGVLEAWQVENHSLRMYWSVIFVTAWVVIVPNSQIVWSVFQLPPPPAELSAFFKTADA